MIAPVKYCALNVYMASASGINKGMKNNVKKKKNVKKEVQHEDFPGGHPS